MGLRDCFAFLAPLQYELRRGAVVSGIRVGDHAPDFALQAANRFTAGGRAQEFSLRQLLAQGAVILEFLRGTW